MWKHTTARVVTDHIIVRRMRIAYCLLASSLKDSFIYSYMHYCFPTATMVTRARLNVTFTRTLPVLFKIVHIILLKLLQSVIFV